MMELPFEFDSEELIAACIRALEPIAVYEAPSARGAASPKAPGKAPADRLSARRRR